MAKKPSGAAGRKAKKQALAVTSGAWLQQSGYTGVSEQWDENAPPSELPIYGVPPITLVKAVNSAILALEQGQFFAAAYLWDGMLRDDRLSAKVEERIDRLIGSPLTIDPAKTIKRAPKDSVTGEAKAPGEPQPTATAQRAAEDFTEQRSRILPLHQVTKLLRTAYSMSVGVAQVITGRDSSGTYPTLKVWNNRYLRYDWLLHKFRLVTENRGEITLEPDDPEWIIYEPFGPHSWLDAAKIRSSALPWLIRYWCRTWWARRQEVHGQPIRLGIIPAQRDPADEKIFLAQLRSLNHEAVIRLPQGEDGNKFDVKLLEASSTDWEGFQALLQHCDDSLAITWLYQSQSTKGQGGLGSQKDAGESTILRIIRKDKLIEEVLRDQLIKPWAEDNYGSADVAPYLNWNIEPPEDEKAKSASDLAIAQAMAQFKTAGAPLNARAYMEDRLGPEFVLTEDEHTAEKQKAVDDAGAMMKATTPPKDDAAGADESGSAP